MIVDRGQVSAALPGYVLGAQLGRGTFGLVLAADHRPLGRPVAIKVMVADGPEGLTVDFAAEARLLAVLDHPHVVRVYDYLEADGLCMVVMELLSGGTLTRRRKAMNPEQSCAVGLAVAAALDHSHTRGVLHRDIKADNILFAGDRTPKVADFGISKMFEGSAATASRLAGTPMYMAPEQIEGGRIGPATDLYALGIVLYQLLTGAPPFDPNQPQEALWRQHLSNSPPPLKGVPGPVADVVLRALAKKPTDRQADAHAFGIELATAATRLYGPGWTDRADLPLHLSDDVRRATELSPWAPRPHLIPPQADTTSGTTVPILRHPRRRLMVAAGATVLAGAVAAAVLLATSSSDTPAVTATASSSTGLPAVVPTSSSNPTSATVDWSQPTPLGDPLAAHTDDVYSVVFSPDGRTLATGAKDNTVRLWNVADPAHPTPLGGPLTGHAGAVFSVVFSPNGRILASGAEDDTVRLWNVADPAHPTPLGGPLTGHTSWVYSVAFSPDGRTLATGSYDGTVRLWDVADPADPAPLGNPLTHTDAVKSVAFSPDGRTLATSSTDGKVQLSNVADPAHPTPLGAPLVGPADSELSSATFSPDGHMLATGSGNHTIPLWNVADPAHPTPLGVPLTGHTDAVESVAFSPDGRTLAGSAYDNTVRLWNVADPARPAPLGWPLAGYTDSVIAVAFSPDGRTLASGVADGTVRLWAAG